MSDLCAKCGAVLSEGSTCQTIFDEFLSLESTNSVYGKVLDLTVACFMIQHGRYSDSALTWMQSKLRVALDEQFTAQQPSQGAAPGMDDATRTWKFTRQADELPLLHVAWSMTISDVAQSIQDPEKYCEQVKQWAQATLKEMDSLFQKSSLLSNEMPSRNGMLSTAYHKFFPSLTEARMGDRLGAGGEPSCVVPNPAIRLSSHLRKRNSLSTLFALIRLPNRLLCVLGLY